MKMIASMIYGSHRDFSKVGEGYLGLFPHKTFFTQLYLMHHYLPHATSVVPSASSVCTFTFPKSFQHLYQSQWNPSKSVIQTVTDWRILSIFSSNLSFKPFFIITIHTVKVKCHPQEPQILQFSKHSR